MKEHQGTSMEGNKKWKWGKYKNTKTTTHHYKDPINHCNHCKIYGHTEGKCWKLHPELNSNNRKKDTKKKSLPAIDSSNRVEIRYDVDEKIVYTSV
jgi:hypothetical protein